MSFTHNLLLPFYFPQMLAMDMRRGGIVLLCVVFVGLYLAFGHQLGIGVGLPVPASLTERLPVPSGPSVAPTCPPTVPDATSPSAVPSSPSPPSVISEEGASMAMLVDPEGCNGFFSVLATAWLKEETDYAVPLNRVKSKLEVMVAQMDLYNSTFSLFVTPETEKARQEIAAFHAATIAADPRFRRLIFQDINVTEMALTDGFTMQHIRWLQQMNFHPRLSDVFRLLIQKRFRSTYVDLDMLLLSPTPALYSLPFVALGMWGHGGPSMEPTNAIFCMRISLIDDTLRIIRHRMDAHADRFGEYFYTELGPSAIQRSMLKRMNTFGPSEPPHLILNENHPWADSIRSMATLNRKFPHTEIHLTGSIRNNIPLPYHHLVKCVREALLAPSLRLAKEDTYQCEGGLASSLLPRHRSERAPLTLPLRPLSKVDIQLPVCRGFYSVLVVGMSGEVAADDELKASTVKLQLLYAQMKLLNASATTYIIAPSSRLPNATALLHLANSVVEDLSPNVKLQPLSVEDMVKEASLGNVILEMIKRWNAAQVSELARFIVGSGRTFIGFGVVLLRASMDTFQERSFVGVVVHGELQGALEYNSRLFCFSAPLRHSIVSSLVWLLEDPSPALNALGSHTLQLGLLTYPEWFRIRQSDQVEHVLLYSAQNQQVSWTLATLRQAMTDPAGYNQTYFTLTDANFVSDELIKRKGIVGYANCVYSLVNFIHAGMPMNCDN